MQAEAVPDNVLIGRLQSKSDVGGEQYVSGERMRYRASTHYRAVGANDAAASLYWLFHPGVGVEVGATP